MTYDSILQRIQMGGLSPSNSESTRAIWVGWQDSTPPTIQSNSARYDRTLVMMRIIIFVFMILRELVRYLAIQQEAMTIQLLRVK